MGLVFALTRKDLKRRLADPGGLLVSLAIPLAIAGVMILTFGNPGGGNQDSEGPRLRMVVVNLDQGPLSEILSGATQNSEANKRMEVKQAADRDEGMRLLREEEYAAMLVIPKGFGADVFNGRKTSLEVLKNPAQSVMPIAAQQIAEVAALYLSGGSKLLGDNGPRLEALFANGGWNDTVSLTALVTTMSSKMRVVDEVLLPPLVEIEEEKKKDDTGGGFDLISWMFPGMIMMAMLFVGMTQMKDLLRERDAGTLRRQLVAPVGAGQVLIAKVISVSVVVAISYAVLAVLGAAAMGIHWGPLLPMAAGSLMLVLAVTGFSALIFSLVRTERQGDALGGILTMVMSLLGGAFVPVQAMPDWMARIARGTVTFWGNETLRALAAGGGWAEVKPYLSVLAALGLVMTSLGVFLMRRRHLGGAL